MNYNECCDKKEKVFPNFFIHEIMHMHLMTISLKSFAFIQRVYSQEQLLFQDKMFNIKLRCAK